MSRYETEALALHLDIPLALAESLRRVLALTTDDANRNHPAFVNARRALDDYRAAVRP
ncbi:MAG: hypothetical protein AMXMBFR76_25840 [Pseudomonadota bacterium]